ncbi:hypothetical protein [Virgisporangium ochraceum]|nr:hypothetical protein [Virgisporangium ochraceum]
MAIDLLRIAAEQGLLVAGLAGGPTSDQLTSGQLTSGQPSGQPLGQHGWRLACQRCRGWLALPARPPEPAWWLRRVYAFVVRHRHPPARRPGHPSDHPPARPSGHRAGGPVGDSLGGARRAAR